MGSPRQRATDREGERERGRARERERDGEIYRERGLREREGEKEREGEGMHRVIEKWIVKFLLFHPYYSRPPTLITLLPFPPYHNRGSKVEK